MSQQERIHPKHRDEFVHFSQIQTRWSDNDIYQHVNNALYYHYVDTVVNRYLMDQEALDIEDSTVVGLVVDTRCTYFAPLVFPQNIDCGLRVAHIGRSSIVYEVGMFAENDSTTAAFARFVHVYVDRASHRPVDLPEAIHSAADQLLHTDDF